MKRWIVPVLIVGTFLIIGLVVWLVVFGGNTATQRYQGDSFSIEVPKEATIEGEADSAIFMVDTEGGSRSTAEAMEDSFGIQVECSDRDSRSQDALISMDDGYNKVGRVNGFSLKTYNKTTINSMPARTFEYENNIHNVTSVAVQTESTVCLVSAYISKESDSTWRPVAERAIQSLTIGG